MTTETQTSVSTSVPVFGTLADIDNRFDYHAPDEAAKTEHQNIRDAAKTFAYYIESSVPSGREKALALTKLEEAMFWCNAAVARIDPLDGTRR